MELEVRINEKSISITINDPYRPDIPGITERISSFASERGTAMASLDLPGLLPRLIRGVVGCEQGCPANAKEVVERGYLNFTLNYVEGGILTAMAPIEGGRTVTIKLFPDF